MRPPRKHTIPIKNARKLRPIGMISKKHNRLVAFEYNLTQEVNGREFSFRTPNNIAICLNVGNREYEMAKLLYSGIIYPKLGIGKNKIIFEDSELDLLYNYFEHIQTSLIFIYTAVEAFANVAIPEAFTHEKLNNKKVKEIWGKEQIERWLSTTEKICDILPVVLGVNSPKGEPFWTDFKKLEEIRNNIIHQKTISNEVSINSKFLSDFFDERIFRIIYAGYQMIEYFCNKSAVPHVYFPVWMGSSNLQPLEVDNIEDYYQEIPGLEDFLKASM